MKHIEKKTCPCVIESIVNELTLGCSENMQQIYRRTPMPKCDFNKVAKQVFRTPFLKNTSGQRLLICPEYLVTETLIIAIQDIAWLALWKIHFQD